MAAIVIVVLVVPACGIVVVIAVLLGHRKYKGEFFHLLQLLVLPGRIMRTEALGEYECSMPTDLTFNATSLWQGWVWHARCNSNFSNQRGHHGYLLCGH